MIARVGFFLITKAFRKIQLDMYFVQFLTKIDKQKLKYLYNIVKTSENYVSDSLIDNEKQNVI